MSDAEQRTQNVKLMLKSEKTELTDEAHKIIRTIKQMEESLEDQHSDGVYKLDDESLKVTMPLTRCLQSLKEKHNTVAKIYRERFEQVKSKYVSYD